jgi:hypothetical protein
MLMVAVQSFAEASHKHNHYNYNHPFNVALRADANVRVSDLQDNTYAARLN